MVVPSALEANPKKDDKLYNESKGFSASQQQQQDDREEERGSEAAEEEDVCICIPSGKLT